MDSLVLDPLEPELIGGLFGRRPSVAESSSLAKLRPRTRFILLALAGVCIVISVAAVDHALTNPSGVQTALALFTGQSERPRRIGLPLSQDPVGLIAIAMTLAGPIFCCEQVRAIRGFNAMNERNMAYRMKTLDVVAINSQTARTNRHFKAVGNRATSILLFLVSGAASLGTDYLIRRWGLFGSWNYTLLSRTTWRREVYAGWWANPHSHFPLAIVLWCVGVFFFYFLIKQLLMGGIFALFVHRVMALDFGVTPNMAANTDGYWGLRPLRRFMEVTYSSTLGHFIMIMGILVVWLPFGAFTILMLLTVMVINILVVIYPSQVALTGAVSEKIHFVAHITGSRRARSEREAVIERVWSTPNLPFRFRSTLTAATIYFLVPVLLALVSSLLGR